MLVISATQEAEMGRISVEAGIKERPYLNYSRSERDGCVAL
jgi:hypothetical protein